MDCSLFLERYSDFRDDLIGETALRRSMVDHLRRCPRCARYDARVSLGTLLLRATRELEPSPGFRSKLARSLEASAPLAVEPVVPGPAGLMAALMVVAALALALLQRPGAEPSSELRARQTASPPPIALVHPAPPFVSFATLEVPAFPRTRRSTSATPISLGRPASVAP